MLNTLPPLTRPALLLSLSLMATAPGLSGCNGDPLFRGVSRGPVVEIVPGVSAPSAPVISLVPTRGGASAANRPQPAPTPAPTAPTAPAPAQPPTPATPPPVKF